jgi:Protein of unknown function (DUF3035)
MIVKTQIALPVLVLAAAALSGCTGVRQAIGLDKNIPDEFSVVARAPLAVPPDFGLRPPQPGAAPSQEQSPQSKAKEAVFRAGAQPGTLPPAATDRSAGEGALLRQAGVDALDPNIRLTITHDREVAPDDERGFADQLLFWRSPPPLKSDKPVDAAQEAERIKAAQASGQPLAPDPANAPTIERKKSVSVFGLF